MISAGRPDGSGPPNPAAGGSPAPQDDRRQGSDPAQARGFGLEEQFGFIPRFISRRTGVEFTSFPAAAASCRPLSLDFDALNIFFRSGFFLNGRTPFREIGRVLPPIEPPALNDRISRDAALDAYIELFHQAIARRRHHQSIIALSGGCDSRHILLELWRQCALPESALTVNLPGRPSEVAIARSLAERVNLRHTVTAAAPGLAADDEAWKNNVTGFASLQHGWFAHVGRARDSLYWWDGIAGDVLSAGLFLENWNLSLFREGRLDELADRLVSRGLIPYFRDQSLFPRNVVLDAVHAELRRHAGAPNPVGAFYFSNRTRIDIGSSAFLLLGSRTLAPYLDRDVWTLLAGLPAEMMVDHQFHIDAVRRAFPEMTDVPYFHQKLKPPRNVSRRKGLSLLLYLLRKRRRPILLLPVLRAMFLAGHASDIDWLLPAFVYGAELEVLAEARD